MQMIRLFTFVVLLIFCNINTTVFSQPWHYDFGTGSGVYTTSGPSLTFLPTPPTDSARVRIGAGGSFNLENQLIPFGSETYLRIAASTSTSVNKFSVFSYSASKLATIKFNIRLGASNGSGGVTSGTWQFFLGDGATYSDNNGFNSAHIFTGMQFIFGAGGTLTTQFRNSSGWTNSGLPVTPFSQGVTYSVDIYANNTTINQDYTYDTPQTVNAGTWDLWIDGILAGDNLSKALLPADVNMDSWMFIGISSTSNSANIFLDEFYYHNDIADTPMPVVMSLFEMSSTGRTALLNWSTLSEINNSGFIVERCKINNTGAEIWENAGFVRGNGTVNEARYYSFSDNNLQTGSYKYRLKQTDFNGNFEYFSPSNLSEINISKPAEFELSQNYPNPSNPSSLINYRIPEDGYVKITLFDLTGKEAAIIENGFQKADYYTALFNGTGLASGIYLYRLDFAGVDLNFSKTMKLVLIK